MRKLMRQKGQALLGPELTRSYKPWKNIRILLRQCF